ncbi:hypothetical protein QYF61_019828 [Mycteria americana]|uniref:Uncharacterized protein n=1 Tax=Mycteria americana TaxID=33587 RepID=A0AAN7MQN9_MYCAM|nr:hypothetical protein QYF61_019828 [Mycteria americana]
MCWGLAHAYRALFNTIQNPQGEEKVSGSGNKMTGTVATPAPSATDTAATTAPSVTGTAATPALATDNAAEPGNQPMLVSVAPIHKKKSWKNPGRWIRLLRLKWLRWIWTDNIKLVWPVTPQAIKEEMQHIDGLVTEGWTGPWTLLHRLSMNVKHVLQSSKPSG